MSKLHLKQLTNANSKHRRQFDYLKNELNGLAKEQKRLDKKLAVGSGKFKAIAVRIKEEKAQSKDPAVNWAKVFHLDKKLKSQKQELDNLRAEFSTLSEKRADISKKAVSAKKRVELIKERYDILSNSLQAKELRKADIQNLESIQLARLDTSNSWHLDDREAWFSQDLRSSESVTRANEKSVEGSTVSQQLMPLTVSPIALAESLAESHPESGWSRMHQLMTEISDRVRRDRLDAAKLSFSFQSDEGWEVDIEVERGDNESVRIVLLPQQLSAFRLLQEEKQVYLSSLLQKGIDVEGIEVRQRR